MNIVSLIIAALTGLFSKLVDDFIFDNDFSIHPLLKETLIGATYILYGIFSFISPGAALLLFSILAIQAFINNGDYSDPMIRTLFILLPFVALAGYMFGNDLHIPSISILNISLLAALFLSFVIDNIYIRAEVSILKLLMRVFFPLYALLLVCYGHTYNISPTITQLYVMAGGYAGASIAFQIYALINGLQLNKEEKTCVESAFESIMGVR
jgi:hypothetical protein